jgi:hypothetical protein
MPGCRIAQNVGLLIDCSVAQYNLDLPDWLAEKKSELLQKREQVQAGYKDVQ